MISTEMPKKDMSIGPEDMAESLASQSGDLVGTGDVRRSGALTEATLVEGSLLLAFGSDFVSPLRV